MIHKRLGAVNGKPVVVFVTRNSAYTGLDSDELYYASQVFDETRGFFQAGGDSIEEAVDNAARRLR